MAPSGQTEAANLKPSIGFATVLGVGVALLSGIGAVIAAADANDTATAAGAAVTVLTIITTLGGRYAQAVKLASNAIVTAGPWIDAAQRTAEQAGAGTITPPRQDPSGI